MKKKGRIILLPRLRHLKLAITQHLLWQKERRTGICQETKSLNSSNMTEEWKEVHDTEVSLYCFLKRNREINVKANKESQGRNQTQNIPEMLLT